MQGRTLRELHGALVGYESVVWAEGLHLEHLDVYKRQVQLFEFFAHLGSSGGISDAGIDFAEKRHADAYGLETAMMDVGRNDVRSKLLAFSDLVHLFGDPAFARKVHLRRIPSAAIHHRCTLFDPSIPPSHCLLYTSRCV